MHACEIILAEGTREALSACQRLYMFFRFSLSYSLLVAGALLEPGCLPTTLVPLLRTGVFRAGALLSADSLVWTLLPSPVIGSSCKTDCLSSSLGRSFTHAISTCRSRCPLHKRWAQTIWVISLGLALVAAELWVSALHRESAQDFAESIRRRAHQGMSAERKRCLQRPCRA